MTFSSNLLFTSYDNDGSKGWLVEEVEKLNEWKKEEATSKFRVKQLKSYERTSSHSFVDLYKQYQQ